MTENTVRLQTLSQACLWQLQLKVMLGVPDLVHGQRTGESPTPKLAAPLATSSLNDPDC